MVSLMLKKHFFKHVYVGIYKIWKELYQAVNSVLSRRVRLIGNLYVFYSSIQFLQQSCSIRRKAIYFHFEKFQVSMQIDKLESSSLQQVQIQSYFIHELK